jgi:hypothetical protein
MSCDYHATEFIGRLAADPETSEDLAAEPRRQKRYFLSSARSQAYGSNCSQRAGCGCNRVTDCQNASRRVSR